MKVGDDAEKLKFAIDMITAKMMRGALQDSSRSFIKNGMIEQSLFGFGKFLSSPNRRAKPRYPLPRTTNSPEAR